MIFNIKKLSNLEKQICFKTISPKAVFAIIGDAIKRRASLSIVRMGDGEYRILKADKDKPFFYFERKNKGWNKRMGIEGINVNELKNKIIQAGNNCTYFAPSVSGISIPKYFVYNFCKSRPHYFDNFFVNDWTKNMIGSVLESSNGVFIIHKKYKKIIQNFKKNYSKKIVFYGFSKKNINDNEQAIDSAIKSGAQLILFSAGPGGKIIGPEIAKSKSKITIDVGNSLMLWSEGQPKKT